MSRDGVVYHGYGNAFAAFTVITAGIGVPFVIAQGGDPVIAGSLAMTAGFVVLC
nr:DUF979 family protein [Tetragenococcus halophilus]